MSFAIKHAPKSLREFGDQETAVKKAVDFIKNFKRMKRKALLFYGPPGTGKTCLAKILAREFGLELVELNASDKRDAAQIRRILGNAILQRSLSHRGKLILIDEVDGIHGIEDRGGVGEIIKLIQETPYPIILTANNPYDPKLRSLREYVELVEFKKIGKRDLRKILLRICRLENIEIDEKALDLIIEFANGDARSAINDLELASFGRKLIKEEDLLLNYRDREKNIFEALGMIFKGKGIRRALLALENLDREISEVILWIAENIPREYEKPEEIALAYDYLSKADLFLARAVRTQYYRLEVYANILVTAGVNLAKKEEYKKFTAYRSPEKIARMWETTQFRRTLRSISDKISEKCHTSSENSYKYYGFMLKFIFKHNKKWGNAIASYLGLNDEEIKFLSY
ncbi:MAG: replication factor C large subunit [Candidatus Nanoarchaeia archaeon]|nr:replication factor C large subunit [Candidatus Haiyanarchaeum thermophilum]MCW1303151.1 replication factor C large subunit [Candidatus Haiyanarchaeum thermophilum]MCW1303816.1 replication factor C large subunit [Candidatus Haiyanarchaeum thermophilum]MCW1306567.1 replication factor C large subunit [Candidatus Haiyanarchaeum thermophilum]MCW1306981.1 replication factor C large subunit [Candidatus Haiyanarchaeum thermophilum]